MALFAVLSNMKRGNSTHPKNLFEVVAQQKKRKGRTWAIAVRRGSYKSLFLLNSGHFPLNKSGNSVLNFGSRKTV